MTGASAGDAPAANCALQQLPVGATPSSWLHAIHSTQSNSRLCSRACYAPKTCLPSASRACLSWPLCLPASGPWAARWARRTASSTASSSTSGGRCGVGVGAGWEEWRHMGGQVRVCSAGVPLTCPQLQTYLQHGVR